MSNFVVRLFKRKFLTFFHGITSNICLSKVQFPRNCTFSHFVVNQFDFMMKKNFIAPNELHEIKIWSTIRLKMAFLVRQVQTPAINTC